MTELEKDIEGRLRRMVEHYGGKCLKFTCPGWRGVPDRIVLLPGGVVIFVEMKRPKGGELSAMQKWWARELIGMGCHYDQVWDNADLEIFRQSWLIKE